MAKSPLGVIPPTIFVLIMIIAGFVIYNAQQKPEDPKSVKMLASLGVTQGTDVDVYENSSDDFNSVKQRYDDLKERLSQYSDIIDVDAFIDELEIECAVYPGKDGCDEDLFDTDDKGCCILKTPEMADPVEYSDTSGEVKVQDAEMDLLCLGAPEMDSDGNPYCPGTNERYSYTKDCCVRACAVYPMNGECETENFPIFENGCCEPNDTTKKRLEAEMRKAKKEMLVGISAMILGDLFLTVMLPKLGAKLLQVTGAKEVRVKAAGDAAKARAKTAAEARGLNAVDTQKLMDNAERRARYNETYKNSKNIRNLVNHVDGIKKGTIQAKAGGKPPRTILSKAIAKASVKFATKVGSRVAIFLARAMLKLGTGPLGIFLMIYDIISIIIDLGDGESLQTYISFEDMVQGRNRIIYAVWDIFQKEEGGPYEYPIVFPVSMAFPNQATIAQQTMTQKCIEDVMTKWVITGLVSDEPFTAEQEREFDIFCKYIVMNIVDETMSDAGTLDMSETLDALDESEMDVINKYTIELIREDHKKYYKFYFDSLVQELQNSSFQKAPLSDDQWDRILKDFPSGPCGNSDLNIEENMSPSPDMIKFVDSMCDISNMGISLTDRGAYYINRPLQRQTWYVYNSIYVPPPQDTDNIISMWTASYDTHTLTIDPLGQKDADGIAPVVKVHRKDVNGNPLDEKIGWLTPYAYLVAMCEGNRNTNIEGRRYVKPCVDEGVKFNVNTGLCEFTSKYCSRYLRRTLEDSVYVADQDKSFLECETPAPGSDEGVLSWVLGDEMAARYMREKDEADAATNAFLDDPSGENFGRALYENVGLAPQILTGKIKDEWENNKATSSSDTEAALKTGMDPIGVNNFAESMDSMLEGKPRYCEKEDECKVFYARHTGGNFQNWVVLVEDEDGNVIRYPSPMYSDQTQVKDNEKHQFYIPNVREADPEKGIKGRKAGWFRATATGDIEENLGPGNVLSGGDCPREITFFYDDIPVPVNPEDPTPTLDISSWRGCMEEKSKADWQEGLSDAFNATAAEYSKGKSCVDDVLFSLGVPYIVEGVKEAGEGFMDVFGPDGYLANPDEYLGNFKDDLENMGVDVVFGYDDIYSEEGIATVGDCLKGKQCNPLFSNTDNLPPDLANEIDKYNRQKNLWEQSKEAHTNSISMVESRANDFADFSKQATKDLELAFTKPSDSKLVDFFGVGESFENTFGGGGGGNGFVDVFNPGNWKSPF